VLQKLKSIIEAQTGEVLQTGPSENLPPLAERNGPNARGAGGRGRDRGVRGGAASQRSSASPNSKGGWEVVRRDSRGPGSRGPSK
jgi:hypothetical protein